MLGNGTSHVWLETETVLSRAARQQDRGLEKGEDERAEVIACLRAALIFGPAVTKYKYHSVRPTLVRRGWECWR